MRKVGAADLARIAPLVVPLVEARRGRGWTQEAVAARLGVSPSGFRAWETLQGVPRTTRYVRWAGDLGFRLVLVDRLSARHTVRRPQGTGREQHGTGRAAQAPEVRGLISVLRAERVRCGLTQREVSRRLGVTVETFNRWERDAEGIRLRALAQWVYRLGYDLRLEPVSDAYPAPGGPL